MDCGLSRCGGPGPLGIPRDGLVGITRDFQWHLEPPARDLVGLPGHITCIIERCLRGSRGASGIRLSWKLAPRGKHPWTLRWIPYPTSIFCNAAETLLALRTDGRAADALVRAGRHGSHRVPSPVTVMYRSIAASDPLARRSSSPRLETTTGASLNQRGVSGSTRSLRCATRRTPTSVPEADGSRRLDHAAAEATHGC